MRRTVAYKAQLTSAPSDSKRVHGGRLQASFASIKMCSMPWNKSTPWHLLTSTVSGRHATTGIDRARHSVVAAFETDFHRTIPAARQYYAFTQSLVRCAADSQMGFSWCQPSLHRHSLAELLSRNDARVISLHLGGSSSPHCDSVGTKRGDHDGHEPTNGLATEQSRRRRFGSVCLPMIMEHTGLSLADVLKKLSTEAGLLGISGGVSGDIRDLEHKLRMLATATHVWLWMFT